MKPILNKISQFFYNLFYFRKIRKFKKINQKLGQSMADRNVEQIILKGEIIKMVRKYLRIDAKSEFIPKDYKNKAEIKQQVLAKFEPRMIALGVQITDELELK